MSENKIMFPEIQKSIQQLIEDEEGNIPGKRLVTIGTMVIVLGSLMTAEAFAIHSSHVSHRSHVSHSSHQSGTYHDNSHSDHGSHESHQSHQSHTSHSNTGNHSNSRFSDEGDVVYSAPDAYSVPDIAEPSMRMSADTLGMPDVNQDIKLPNGTPVTGVVPSLAVPASTVESELDSEPVNVPVATESVE